MAQKEKRISCWCIANVDGICAADECCVEIRCMDSENLTLQQAKAEYEAMESMFAYCESLYSKSKKKQK